uniref:Chromosome 3 open reading frame 17 n=1 Tax=Nothobranchius pienaari TaxID=704102 RepID=A0A1A8LMK1_9TELE
MAAEPWNRVNIPFPSATSSVHIRLTSTTAEVFKTLQRENSQVLKLLRSNILWTEIRVLYELLYVLNNSMRGNKTFKGLQQVEQCVNRLKNMKLDAALEDLANLCPTKIQMTLCTKSGECNVPSQPTLEWTCLKVLGASKLLSCTLTRCKRAFILTRQQMKLEEFVLLCLVITSMLSRLWVIFRGILVGLAKLYPDVLELLRDVSQAQPMPYLTGISLPATIAEILSPSDKLLLKTHRAFDSHVKDQKIKQQTKKNVPVKERTQGKTRKITEDLGVLVKRDIGLDADIKPLFNKEQTKCKSLSGDLFNKQKVRKQVEDASTFSRMSANLEGIISQCRSLRMRRTKRLLSFLHLKCQRLKCLEAAGYNLQRKFQVFRQEVCWALSLQRSRAKTCSFSAPVRRTASSTSTLHSLKTQFMLIKVRMEAKKTRLVRRRKERDLSAYFKENLQSKALDRSEIDDIAEIDDIDEIFASAGL